jgi:hypothetical protein
MIEESGAISKKARDGAKRYKPRRGPDFGTAYEDLKLGQAQMAAMAVYWGKCTNSLQAQVRALLALREKLGVLNLCLVSAEDMDQMRQIPITGYPVYYAKYPDGVTKFYPIPEEPI